MDQLDLGGSSWLYYKMGRNLTPRPRDKHCTDELCGFECNLALGGHGEEDIVLILPTVVGRRRK